MQSCMLRLAHVPEDTVLYVCLPSTNRCIQGLYYNYSFFSPSQQFCSSLQAPYTRYTTYYVYTMYEMQSWKDS